MGFSFTGLSAAQVLGLFGALGAATVALYLLKLRRRRVEVPFVRLWESVLADQKTTRLFSQLKRWLSLLLALGIVGALSLALGDPKRLAEDVDGRTIVVLLDTSASMQSTDVTPSRFEAGRRAVRELIDGLGPEDRMLLVALGRSATPMGPMSTDPAVLKSALDAVAPADVAASLRAGLALAADVLHEAPSPEVVVVTDGATEVDAAEGLSDLLPSAVRLSWVRVGRSDENVGIASFAVRRYPLDKTQSEVLIELWNPSENARSVELTLLGDGQTIDVQRLHLGPGERLRRFFGDVSGADATLEARLHPTDGRPDYLPADDRAFARLPPRQRARVEVVSDGNLYLEAALLLDEYLDVHQVTPAGYDPDGPYDVLIFDRWVPDAPPRKPALYLAPAPRAGGAAPLEVLGTLERPFFDRVDRRHPLTRFAVLHDVNVADALELSPAQGDHVVAADRGGPLLVEGRRDDVPFVALAFDVRRSDLPLRVAWPLLLLNTLDFFAEAESGFHSSYETGETWRVPVAAGATEAVFIDPDGHEARAPVVDGRAVWKGERAGFYRVRAAGAEEIIAANLGPSDEPRIHPGDELRVAERKASEPSSGPAGARQRIWVYLATLVLAVLMFEWVLYHRRLTV
jgi:hypothetical protein